MVKHNNVYGQINAAVQNIAKKRNGEAFVEREFLEKIWIHDFWRRL